MSEEGPAYEMQWDCKSCGTKKLLGVTHRHCPNCGSAQDPKQRYFPKEGEEVALKDHVFVGVDKHCSACSSPMSAKATFCTNCGASLDGTKAVNIKTDAPVDPNAGKRPPPVKAPPPPSAGGSKKWMIIGGGIALLGALIFLMTWSEKKQLSVAGHAWARTIDVEEYYESKESKDCSSMPGGADLSRRWDDHRTRDVQKGESCKEECSTARVDKGDGSFKKDKTCKNVCTPKYVKESYTVAVCDYTIGRWKKTREANTNGKAREPAPGWPTVKLAGGGGSKGYGKEKEGNRREVYKLSMKDDKGKVHECELKTQKLWETLAPDAAIEVDFGISGNPDCGSVRAQGGKGANAVSR